MALGHREGDRAWPVPASPSAFLHASRETVEGPPDHQNHSAGEPQDTGLGGLCGLPAGAGGSVCNGLSPRATSDLFLLQLLPSNTCQLGLWGLFPGLDPAGSGPLARTAMEGGGLARSKAWLCPSEECSHCWTLFRAGAALCWC